MASSTKRLVGKVILTARLSVEAALTVTQTKMIHGTIPVRVIDAVNISVEAGKVV